MSIAEINAGIIDGARLDATSSTSENGRTLAIVGSENFDTGQILDGFDNPTGGTNYPQILLPSFPSSGALFVSWWASPASGSTDMAFGVKAAGGATSVGIRITEDGRLRWNNNNITGASLTRDGTFRHWVLTRSASGGQWTIFQNGVLNHAYGETDSSSPDLETNPFKIGVDVDGSDSQDEVIDDIAYGNIEINTENANIIYTNGLLGISIFDLVEPVVSQKSKLFLLLDDDD